MGILDNDIYDDGRASLDELIAKGKYESNKENILKGFKIFQKMYIYKSVVLQMFLVVLGLASQIIAVVSANENTDVGFSYLLIVMCVVLGIYLLIRPKNTYRKLENSLGELDGTTYQAEIYTNKIIISTLYEMDNVEEVNITENANENDNSEDEDKLPPATIIHLDNSSVEMVECSDMFLVYIKKVNMFVIPKDAFKAYELDDIKNRLSNIMGVRYKSE